MTWNSAHFAISNEKATDSTTVAGWVSPPFGVHYSVDYIGYVVTHLPTGLIVGHTFAPVYHCIFAKPANAMAFADAIRDLANWTEWTRENSLPLAEAAGLKPKIQAAGAPIVARENAKVQDLLAL